MTCIGPIQNVHAGTKEDSHLIECSVCANDLMCTIGSMGLIYSLKGLSMYAQLGEGGLSKNHICTYKGRGVLTYTLWYIYKVKHIAHKI